MKCHPVFHVSLLEPTASDPLEGQKRPPPPPVIVDEEVEYEVAEILDTKGKGKNLKYHVRWVGYDITTWEPADLLKNSPVLVRQFHKKYPKKPQPDFLPPL